MAAVQRHRALLTLSSGLRPSYGSQKSNSIHLARQPSVRGHPLLLRSTHQSPSSKRSASSSSLPYILQPSLWRSLVPKVLRSKRDPDSEETKPKKKEWNPTSFFILLFLLIGSQAIHLISMRRDFDKFSAETEGRLASLREVVRRIQNGEHVDVEGMLGTGDVQAEREWEDVIRELEEEDASYRERRRRKLKKAAQAEQDTAADTPSDTTS